MARPRQVVWCAAAGLAAPTLAFIAAGVALQAATGTWNLADVLVELDSARAAQMLLALGFSGSVLTNLHSGGAALSGALAPLGRRAGLALVALAGTALAVAGLADQMLGYLGTMAVAAPGLVPICVLFWTTGRRSRDKWGIPALAGWAIGLMVGVALSAVESPLALPAALAATGGAYATINVFLGNDAEGE